MKALGLLSLLAGVTIVAVIAVNQFTNKSSGVSEQKNSINQASAVAAKADLKAISTELNLYYSENSAYPSSLSQVDLSRIDKSKYSLQSCSPTSIVLKTSNSSESLLLVEGQETFGQNQTC